MDLSHLSESFLHYVWKFGFYESSDLKSIKGDALTVISAGVHNHDAGPDFSSAQIQIGDRKWVGNVEIHINSSDWDKHNHEQDEKYRNVILHVVYHHDKDLEFFKRNNIPTLILKDRVKPSIFKNYLLLQSSEHEILCHDRIENVNPLIISSMMEKSAMERLSKKATEITRIYEYVNKDWEKTLYVLLAKYFGARVNTDAFERLARSVDLNILSKHRDQSIQVEALLFGQSGLLPRDSEYTYVQAIRKEYDFLKKKYSLSPLEVSIWKFARMRPISFPTIRIALFSSLLTKQDSLFSKIKETSNPKEIIELLDCETHPFFDTHFHFNKESKYLKKSLGKKTKDVILINAVAPLLYFYGQKTDDSYYYEKATSLLENIESEQNKIIRKWNNLGVKSNDALQSQGLIQLTKSYCLQKRCVDCNIGYQLLKE
jgi:hypothetical protein